MDAATVEKTRRFLGETMGFWVQTGALIISAIAAIWLIWANKRDGKRRATIDLVIEQKQDSELQEAKRHIINLHEKKPNNFAKYLEDRNSDDFRHIVRVLNNYEFIASGIREGAFDQELFKRMQYSVVMTDWSALSGFVMEFRRQTNRPTLFQEFELLAKAWKNKALKLEV